MNFNKTSVIVPHSLDELRAVLRKEFDKDDVDVDYVQAVMTNYKSNKEDCQKYAHYDPHRYTRNLLDDGNGKYNLMMLCWSEGQVSSIHSHANSHCFLKVMEGTLTESLYDWPTEDDEKLNKKRRLNVHEDDVAYINDSIGLHRIENASNTELACSLHLYSPPYDECYSFDEKTAHRRLIKVNFYSKFGERTPFNCPSAAESRVIQKANGY